MVLLKLNENFQDSNNGWQKACNEISAKRIFLKQYMAALRSPVQDLSGVLLKGIDVKNENMNYQNQYTDSCLNNLTQGCMALASVDSGVFQTLPDMDLFYQNLLIGGYDLETLLDQLNFYSNLLNCPLVPGSQATYDASDNSIEIDRDIGVVDTEGLAYNLESLSPYYLSPDVVQYLLKFLISQEQLDNLNYTSIDYINQETKLVKQLGCFYNGTNC